MLLVKMDVGFEQTGLVHKFGKNILGLPNRLHLHNIFGGGKGRRRHPSRMGGNGRQVGG